MIYVDITGGFANQLFRYAAVFQFCKKFNQQMIIQAYDKECYVDAYLLDLMNIQEHKKIISRTVTSIDDFKRHFEIDDLFLINDENYLEEYEKDFLEHENYYFDDSFQRTAFVKEVLPEIREMFSLKRLSKRMNQIKCRLDNECSIGVHVRRRDFIDIKRATNQNIEENFYKAAVAYFRSVLPDSRFYVFSDDIEFCRNYFGECGDISYVKLLGGKRADIEEFLCLSWCRHRILTRGSSFGRMADILNSSSEKITIYKGNDDIDGGGIIYFDDERIREYNQLYSIQKKESVPKDGGIEYVKLYTEENPENYCTTAKSLIDESDYKEAELALSRGWQFGHRNLEFIKLYVDVLLKNENYHDAALVQKNFRYFDNVGLDLSNEFPDEYSGFVERINQTEIDMVIILPNEPFKNCEYNHLTNVGILFEKMGLDVIYIFNESTSDDLGSIKIHNEILNSNYMYTNCEGFYYNSRMYNRSRVEKQYKLADFVDELCWKRNAVILSEDGKIFNSLNSSALRVWWNASNTFRKHSYEVKSKINLENSIDLIVSDYKCELSCEYCLIDPDPWYIEHNEEMDLYTQYRYSSKLYAVIDSILGCAETGR